MSRDIQQRNSYNTGLLNSLFPSHMSKSKRFFVILSGLIIVILAVLNVFAKFSNNSLSDQPKNLYWQKQSFALRMQYKGEIELALIKYKEQNAKCPADLYDLVPTFIPSLKIDPLTSAPFSYRVQGNHCYVGEDGDLAEREVLINSKPKEIQFVKSDKQTEKKKVVSNSTEVFYRDTPRYFTASCSDNKLSCTLSCSIIKQELSNCSYKLEAVAETEFSKNISGKTVKLKTLRANPLFFKDQVAEGIARVYLAVDKDTNRSLLPVELKIISEKKEGFVKNDIVRVAAYLGKSIDLLKQQNVPSNDQSLPSFLNMEEKNSKLPGELGIELSSYAELQGVVTE